MKPEPSKTIRLIRWEGQEIRYEDQDREFVHEMLSHNLGFKNAGLVMMQQTSDEDTWQCAHRERYSPSKMLPYRNASRKLREHQESP
ncbi:hypothetical protein [Enterobacter phage vB_EcRAM-01]|nr:hypothetical protein [Enterobacter phage vB_EcRAM-01]